MKLTQGENRSRQRRGQVGQVASEMMMLVSVIVVGVVAVSYTFIPSFRIGVTELGLEVSRQLEEGGSRARGWGMPAQMATGSGGDTGALVRDNADSSGARPGKAGCANPYHAGCRGD